MSETRVPDAPVVTVPPALDSAERPASQTPPASCPTSQVADTVTHACILVCGTAPEAPKNTTIDPVCGDVTLKDGRSWHAQLTLQLSSSATTRIDCPRMNFRGQDTPICVTKVVAGRTRGACCPPGHTDPTDPECVAEGSVDEMYKRQRVWEWCNGKREPKNACDPCVWSR